MLDRSRLRRNALPGRIGCATVTAPYVHELRVRYGECDPQGIVFNANYLLYFDVAFTEMWRAAVGPWDAMLEDGVDAVVAETGIRFLAPARFDDELALTVGLTRLGTTAMTTRIEVLRGAETLVSGWLRHVVVSRETWSKTEIPAGIREGLERFLLDDEIPARDAPSDGFHRKVRGRCPFPLAIRSGGYYLGSRRGSESQRARPLRCEAAPPQPPGLTAGRGRFLKTARDRVAFVLGLPRR